MLSHVLMHKPLRHPGMPRHLVVSSASSAVTSLSSHGLGVESQDVSSIVLALRTLGSFNFDGNATLWY
jgi:FKBP12-rapamycin complex-associated protein